MFNFTFNVHKTNTALSLFVPVFFILSYLGLSECPVYAKSANGEVKILFSNGKVEVRSTSTRVWEPAKQGDLLAKGSEIRTRDSAVCDLIFDSGSAVKLKADSQMILSDLKSLFR